MPKNQIHLGGENRGLTDLEQAQVEIEMFIDFYNVRRFHSAIG